MKKICKVFFLLFIVLYNLNYGQSVNCFYTIENQDKYGLINHKGEVVVAANFIYISNEPDENGCFIFNQDNNHHGYIDNRAHLHYLNYWIEYFHEGLAAFGEDYNYGFINREGIVVIKPQSRIRSFESTASDIDSDLPSPFFSEDLCSIVLSFSEEKGKLLYGYINKKGEIVFKPKWLFASPFREGLAMVIDTLDNRYYINKQGAIVINLKNDEVGSSFCSGLAAIYSDEDEDEEKKCYFINKTGKRMSTTFTDAGDFHEGFAKVKKDGKWGFINTEGKYVIEPSFYEVTDFTEGLASATVLDSGNIIRTGIIDLHGNFVLPPEKNVQYGQFRCGIVAKYVRDGYNNQLEAYMDRKGKIIWSR